jgi:enoyl-CoA hydratase/carnithine racemase
VSGPLVRSEQRDGFDVAVLDSTANRNAMSIQLLTELAHVVDSTACGTGRALLIEHTGQSFCSGVDLKERAALGPADARHSELLAELLRALWCYPRPVVCRIDGAVRGGGLGLLACADIAVCSPESTFAYSEVRVGVAPALVSALALAKVPVSSLLPWLLTGATFDAEVAHRIGLITRIDAVASPAVELDGLARSAPGAVAAMKAIVRGLIDLDVERLIPDLQRASADLFAGAEAQEGMAAFAQRRPPAWSTAR